MDFNTAVTICVFLLSQAASLIWFLVSLKVSSAITNERLDGMQKEMTKMAIAIDGFSRLDTRVVLVEERQLAQGKRLDESLIAVNTTLNGLSSRLNRYVDEEVFAVMKGLPRVTSRD